MMKPARVVVGCEQLGGTDWGPMDRDAVERAVDEAFDLGLRAFDTADVYGLGESERRLAAALGRNRHEAFIVTKGGVRWQKSSGRAVTRKDNSPAYLAQAINDSLGRLRIEKIDLYFVHWPDGVTPIEAVLECLERARGSGKIAAYGLSNFPVDMVLRASDAELDAVQVSCNLLSSPEEWSGLARMGDAGLHRYGYGALAQGLLTGKYDANSRFHGSDRRHRLPHFQQANWPQVHKVLDALKAAARRSGRRPAELAIQAVRHCGLIDSVIVGIKTPAQVRELAALDSHMADDAELRSLLSLAGVAAAPHRDRR